MGLEYLQRGLLSGQPVPGSSVTLTENNFSSDGTSCSPVCAHCLLSCSPETLKRAWCHPLNTCSLAIYSLCSSLQSVQVSLKGSTAFRCVSQSSSFYMICFIKYASMCVRLPVLYAISPALYPPSCDLCATVYSYVFFSHLFHRGVLMAHILDTSYLLYIKINWMLFLLLF